MERRRKETKEWEPWLPDGHTVSCVFCGNTMQYRRERAFSHYGWRAKSTRGICTKAPRPMKAKFSECGDRIPAYMEQKEMYGQGGEANVPTSSQSTLTNGGIGNVASVGPSSPNRGTSSTKPNRVLQPSLVMYSEVLFHAATRFGRGLPTKQAERIG